MTGLQPALPRELYVDPAAYAVERERVLLREWTCVGRRADLGLADPARLAVVDVLGESVILTADTDGALHAAYNVCRHRGAQLFPAEPGAAPQTCSASALRCPYHSWTYGLDGSLLRAPHAEGVDRTDFSLHPVAVDEWAGFVFVRLVEPGSPTHPAQAGAPLASTVERPDRTLAHYDIGALVTGRTLSYQVAANWKVVAENYNECYHCGPVHPELCRLVPAFAGGGADLDWDHGVPHREGAWTFTMSGTTTRAPAAGPGRDRAHPPQGRAGLPEPDAVLLGRPRRRVRAAPAGDRPDTHRLPAALRRRRGGRSGLRPLRRRRAVGPGEPAGLGDLRIRAAGDVLAGLYPRLVRADGGRLRRHPALAAARGWSTP